MIENVFFFRSIRKRLSASHSLLLRARSICIIMHSLNKIRVVDLLITSLYFILFVLYLFDFQHENTEMAPHGAIKYKNEQKARKNSYHEMHLNDSH